MKRFAMTLGILWMMLPAAPFICAAGSGRDDTGGYFVWLFLGLCALIVVLQILPTVKRLMGLARETKVHEPAPEKQAK